jgi:diguanylate cyclase (GGDEF)-like protein
MSWQSIQDALIERLWNAMVILAAIGMPASVARAFVTGWLPAYGFHISLSIIVIVITVFRKRVPSAVKAAVIVSLLAVAAFSGLLNFGLFSQVSVISVVFVLLSGIMFRRRTAIVLSVMYVAALTGVVMAFASGRLRIAFDANTYAQSSAGWMLLMLVTVLLGTFVPTGLATYRNSIRSLLLEVEQQRDTIEHLATHDPLTGLPTYRLASDRLEMALNTVKRTASKGAVLFIDLDGFKHVNDTHGHEAGDVVLKEVARRLKDAIRTSDTAARIGGDEFLVILRDLPEQTLAAESARRIIDAIGFPMVYKGLQLFIGCSIGIAIFPDHATDAASLRRLADAAMYAVKRQGKNNFAFCTAP